MSTPEKVAAERLYRELVLPKYRLGYKEIAKEEWENSAEQIVREAYAQGSRDAGVVENATADLRENADMLNTRSSATGFDATVALNLRRVADALESALSRPQAEPNMVLEQLRIMVEGYAKEGFWIRPEDVLKVMEGETHKAAAQVGCPETLKPAHEIRTCPKCGYDVPANYWPAVAPAQTAKDDLWDEAHAALSKFGIPDKEPDGMGGEVFLSLETRINMLGERAEPAAVRALRDMPDEKWFDNLQWTSPRDLFRKTVEACRCALRGGNE